MFNLSFERLFFLALFALFVLGPERLPAAAATLGRAIRQIKSYASGANEQLRRELGPELDHLREPLAQLREPLEELRGPLHALRRVRNPRAAVTRYLLSDPELSDPQPPSSAPAPHPTRRSESLQNISRPPVDPDAT